MMNAFVNLAVGALLAAVLSFAACARFAPPPLEPTKDDASVEAATSGSLCELACENLGRMGCPESDGTCAAVCESAEDAGNPMNTICLANASTPDQARACGTVRCKGR